jgi:NAD+ synthase
MRTLSIALGQINPVVGDLAGNSRAMLAARQTAATADLIVFPELALCGYPPEDLVLRPAFVQATLGALQKLAATTVTGPAMLVGTLWPGADKPYNAAALLAQGDIQAVTAKMLLPNYGVFDERRVFQPGPDPVPLVYDGVRLGVMICEDMWEAGPAWALHERGADILVALNGSPFETGKPSRRLDLAAARCRETHLSLIYVNMVGGQDELVFDGRSFVLHPNGQPALHLPAWQEAVQITHWRENYGVGV